MAVSSDIAEHRRNLAARRGGHTVVIVTGDRHATLECWGLIVWWALWESVCETDTWTLVHGNQRSIDRMSVDVAREIIPPPAKVRAYDADWDTHGRSAGPIRNGKMLTDANTAAQQHGFPLWVLAFHDDLDGQSRGTRDCVTQARRLAIPTAHYRSDGTLTLWRPEREDVTHRPAHQQPTLEGT